MRHAELCGQRSRACPDGSRAQFYIRTFTLYSRRISVEDDEPSSGAMNIAHTHSRQPSERPQARPRRPAAYHAYLVHPGHWVFTHTAVHTLFTVYLTVARVHAQATAVPRLLPSLRLPAPLVRCTHS